MNTNPNENINPTGDHRDCQAMGGLTKREYFSGLAMAANITGNPTMRSEEIARVSVRDANALIAELNKINKP